MAPVAEIMTKDLYTVSVDTPLSEVSNLFRKARVRHLPVINDGKLVGIVSQTDILRMSFGSHFGEDETDADEAIFEMLNLAQVMVSDPVTVQADQPVDEVADLLSNKEFHALPVLEGDELVGIVTTTDIIRYLLQNLRS